MDDLGNGADMSAIQQALASYGAAAWTPAAIAGLKMWFAISPSTCFTDTARTTTCSVGDDIKGITDLSGNSNHCTWERGTPFVLRQSGGIYYAEMSSSTWGYSTPLTLASGPQCIAFSDAESAASFSRFVHGDDGASNHLISSRRTDGNGFYVNGTVCADFVADSNRHTTFVAKAGGGNWRLARDGVSKTVNSNSNNFAKIALGAIATFNEFVSGSFFKLVAYEANPSGAEQASLETYLAS